MTEVNGSNPANGPLGIGSRSLGSSGFYGTFQDFADDLENSHSSSSVLIAPLVA